MHSHVHTWMQTNVCFVNTHVCTHACTYMHAHPCVHIHAHMCTLTYMHTHTAEEAQQEAKQETVQVVEKGNGFVIESAEKPETKGSAAAGPADTPPPHVLREASRACGSPCSPCVTESVSPPGTGVCLQTATGRHGRCPLPREQGPGAPHPDVGVSERRFRALSEPPGW